MTALRRTVAAFLLVAWLPAVNVCALTYIFPAAELDPCCQTELSAPPPTEKCGDCVTLENGLPLSSLTPLVAQAPDIHVDAWLTDLLATLVTAAAKKPLLFEHTAIPPEPPLWQLVACTALPVRAPSFA